MSSPSPTMPLLGRHSEPNVTTQSPRNFSKPFSSPGSPITPDSVHDCHSVKQTYPFPWAIPQRESPPLRRKPSRVNLIAPGDDRLSGRNPVTRESITLAPLQNRPQLAPSAFPPFPLQQHSPISPSLTSSITTLESTPTQSPIVLGPAGSAWRSAENTRVSTKRKYPFVLAKRLPRHETREWCVYAAVVERGEGDFEATDSAAETESERDEEADAQRLVEYRRARSVRFAGLEKEVESATEQSNSGDDKETTAGSTYTLSKFKFPKPPGHPWAGTFGTPATVSDVLLLTPLTGHFVEPTPPTSPATLHYRGASFDVVNPHASLLLGKHDIETPAEIDGLLDDYFADRTTVSYEDFAAKMSNYSLASSQDGSRRARTLYADPESARQNIMRLPSGPYTAAPPAQESPLAGRGNTSTTPVDNDNHAVPMGPLPHPDSNISRRRAPPEEYGVARDDSFTSLRSDPFDLRVSLDAGTRLDRIDEVIYRQPRMTAGADYDDEGADADEATVYLPDRDSTVGNILNEYGRESHYSDDFPANDTYQAHSRNYANDSPLTRDGYRPGNVDGYYQTHGGYYSSPHGTYDDPVSPSVEHGRNSQYANVGGYGPMGYHQGHAYRPTSFEHAHYPPPGLPVATPPVRMPYQLDCTDLPTSDQTYGATTELLRVTRANGMTHNRSYPYSTGEPSMYPPMLYDGVNEPSYPPMATVYANAPYPSVPHAYQQESYYPHDSMHNLSPPGLFQQYSGIPATGPNADQARNVYYNQQTRYEHCRPDADQDSEHAICGAGDDDAWSDEADVGGAAESARPPQRESQFSSADYSDNGDWDQDEQDEVAARNTVVHHGVRLLDGTRGPMPYYMPDLDKLARVSGFELHVPDVKHGMSLIKEALQQKVVMSAYGGAGVRAAEQRYNDVPEQKLAALIIKNPDAMLEAANRVAFEVPNMRPDPGRAWLNGYNPHTAFRDLMEKLGVSTVDTLDLPKKDLPPQQDLSEIVRQVIGPRAQSSRGASPGLAYSETVATFKTIATTPDIAKPEPVHSRDSQRTGRAEEYEMHELVRHTRPGKGRPAMSGQTTLRELRLNTNVESSTTSCVPGRRLTDSELARREPNWRMSPHNDRSPRTAFELPDNTPLLRGMHCGHVEAGGRDNDKEKRAISIKYFALTALCPVTAVLYGLGKFDSRARSISEGRVDGMMADDKLWALWVVAPLSTIFYAIVIIAIAIVCVVVH